MPLSSLDFVCPVCKAQPQEKCALSTGAPRFESHVERKWIARDHQRKVELEEPPPSKQK
jgi:hypothetical protein